MVLLFQGFIFRFQPVVFEGVPPPPSENAPMLTLQGTMFQRACHLPTINFCWGIWGYVTVCGGEGKKQPHGLPKADISF